MVCIPCIVIPLLLFVWHKFIQPFILKFWNPFGLLDDGSNRIITKKKVGMFDVQIVDHKSGKMKELEQKRMESMQQENGASEAKHSKSD